MSPDDLIPWGQARARLKCSRQALRRLIARGALRAWKPTRKLLLVSRGEVERHLAQSLIPAKASE